MASEQVKWQKLGLLYEHLPLSLVATVVNAAILAFFMAEKLGTAVPAVWFAANVVLSAARFLLYRAYGCSPHKERQAWLVLFTLGVALAAVLWALTSLVMFPPDSVVHQVFLAFVIAGMVAGALSSLAQMFRLYALYNIVILLPLSLQFFFGEHAVHPYMGTMILLFMVITLISAHRMSRMVEESFLLRNSNDTLVMELSEEKERVVEALQEANSANTAKDIFLANMSHEIRTPLNGVIGFTQLLVKTPLDERQRTYVGTIEKSSHMLLGILNDILDFSKIGSGKMNLEERCFSVSGELLPVTELFKNLATEKSVALETDFTGVEGIFVIGDPLRLKQVLSNLLSNAVKFTPESGEIRVRVSVVQKGEREMTFRVEVTDNGPGIRPENLEKIFEPFAQEDNSVSRKYGGTGLGLAICNSFLQLMGSELQVRSRLGEGTTFSFDVTSVRCGDEVAPQEAFAEERVPVRGVRVLVVEDNPTNLMLAEIMLGEELGLAVDTAHNGLEALQKVESGKNYALILMDINMPQMDGEEATRRMRAFELEHGLERTPIVALSANVLKEDQQRYLQSGMDATLAKPLVFEALEEVLQRFVHIK